MMIMDAEPPPDLAEIKRRARLAAKARRRSLSEANRERAGLVIADRLLDVVELRRTSVVSGYLPIRSEVDVRPILQRLRDQGHITVLPCVVESNAPLVFRQWIEGDTLVAEPFGTLAPDPAAREREPDLLLVPLLAFDPRGVRLGYGGGFFDRTLEALRKRKSVVAIGVAFGVQEVGEVPADESDQPLDLIVTERRVILPHDTARQDDPPS